MVRIKIRMVTRRVEMEENHGQGTYEGMASGRELGGIQPRPQQQVTQSHQRRGERASFICVQIKHWKKVYFGVNLLFFIFQYGSYS